MYISFGVFLLIHDGTSGLLFDARSVLSVHKQPLGEAIFPTMH